MSMVTEFDGTAGTDTSRQPYTFFAGFYDRVTEMPTGKAALLKRIIARHMPSAKSVLELGCGTGSVLAELDESLSVTGLDTSQEMLNIAQQKLPKARFVCQDMATFELRERFDVIVCMADALNHLPAFELWKQVIDRAWIHLVPGGLFFVDVTTIGGFRELAAMHRWIRDDDGMTAITDIRLVENDRCSWDIRVFVPGTDGRYDLHRERLLLYSMPVERLRLALLSRFKVVEESDLSRAAPTNDSRRALFSCRRPSG